MTHSKSEQCQDEMLQQQIDELPLKISPERDLWQGIERAIMVKKQHHESEINNHAIKVSLLNSKASLAWAASIIIAVLLTWTGVDHPLKGQSQLDLVSSMQLTFEQQKKTMLVSLGQPDLSDLSANMQDQFTQLTSAQNTIKKALEQDPNNAELLNLLRWTQQQELDLLNQLYRPKWQSI